jgi:hypothetical protein
MPAGRSVATIKIRIEEHRERRPASRRWASALGRPSKSVTYL